MPLQFLVVAKHPRWLSKPHLAPAVARKKHGERVIRVCSGLPSLWQSFWPGFLAIWGPVESHRLSSANLAVSFFWYYLHWLLCEIKSMKSCFWVYAVSETLNNDTNFSLCKNLRFLQPSRQWLLLKADLLVWRVAENSQCGKEWFQCYPQGALWDSGKTTTQPDLWRCWTMLPQLPGRAKNLSRNLPV